MCNINPSTALCFRFFISLRAWPMEETSVSCSQPLKRISKCCKFYIALRPWPMDETSVSCLQQ